MELINKLVYTIFHLKPETLNSLLEYVGPGKLYVLLFIILFCETGLVVTPFLPGDSLLFTLGAVGAHPSSPINLPLISALLVCAALLGDNTNYWIGYRLGAAVFNREDSRFLKKKHLLRAQAFYETYGAKTIILARFVPIVRTFAPFVAGIGKMSYPRFLLFSVLGACLWVAVCVTAGYFLASVSFVQKHFELVVIAIVVISVLPMAIEYWRHRREEREQTRKGFAVTPTSTAAKVD